LVFGPTQQPPALIAFAAADAFAGLFSLDDEADGEKCAERDSGDQNTIEQIHSITYN